MRKKPLNKNLNRPREYRTPKSISWERTAEFYGDQRMSILSTSVQKTAGQLSMSDLAKAVKKPAVRHVHKPDIPPPTEPKATRPHKTPGHIIAAIRADRRTGMTYAAIAERHGVSQSVAQQACYDMAVGRSRSIFTDEFKRSVIADWKLGLTIVCEKYGLTEGQAKNIYARRMKK